MWSNHASMYSTKWMTLNEKESSKEHWERTKENNSNFEDKSSA